ncbi:MAG: metal ABC transporter permease [Aigarchaeota archaeon]|nr:metal ABC transporter permease [Aigarchaeota archaeon]MDW8093281.1 metal ABC transporter permease [Nitrososphaerota archaeon]
MRAYLAGAITSSILSVVGAFAVHKRLSLLGDATSHISFAGIALGMILGLTDNLLAYLFAGLAIFGMVWFSRVFRLPGDVALVIFLMMGASLASIMITLTGLRVNFIGLLFGNILAVGWVDVLIAACLLAATASLLSLRFRQLFLYVLNVDIARLKGVNVRLYEVIVSLLLASSIVTGIKLVGVLMVTALLVLPTVAASALSPSFRSSLIYAVIISSFSTLNGISISFVTNVPPGSATVVTLLAVTIVTLAHRRFTKRFISAGTRPASL